jgi:hypothetical protein
MAVLEFTKVTPQVNAQRELREPEVPPLIRLTGILVPPEEKTPETYLNKPFTLILRDKKWIMRVTNVEDITGSRIRSEFNLVDAIYPAELHLVGPEKLIETLMKPEIAGKLISIEGRLYIGERMLVVVGVKEVEKEE